MVVNAQAKTKSSIGLLSNSKGGHVTIIEWINLVYYFILKQIPIHLKGIANYLEVLLPHSHWQRLRN